MEKEEIVNKFAKNVSLYNISSSLKNAKVKDKKTNKWISKKANIDYALDREEFKKAIYSKNLIKILKEVADKFGDARRTKILNIVENSNETPLEIQEEDVGIMLFDNNMIRMVKRDELQGGKRGRKGVNIKPPKNANLINTLYTSNLGTIAAFTNLGRMYNFPLADLDFDKDYSIYELILSLIKTYNNITNI